MKKDGRKAGPAAVIEQLALSALLLATTVALLARLIVLLLLSGLSLLIGLAGLTGHVLFGRILDVFTVVSFFIWFR
jgi:hypothetical protein